MSTVFSDENPTDAAQPYSQLLAGGQPGQVFAPSGKGLPADPSVTVPQFAPAPVPSVASVSVFPEPPVRSTYMSRRLGSVAVSHELADGRRAAKSGGFFTLRGQLRSLAIGLSCGLAVILISFLALFNELVIAPFIRPSSSVQVPVADQSGMAADPSPKIRIPKINVEIPIVYGLTSTDEKQFSLALDNGVVHYPTTELPGQPGNTAFFGHSSNNIFNPGKYKFAFVLLHELAVGDKFYITHEGKLYTYVIIGRHIVKPSEVGVLSNISGQTATATLITCDPPGTSNNRLVVVGQQVDPLPNGGARSVPESLVAEEAQVADGLPGNGPGLLNRIVDAVF